MIKVCIFCSKKFEGRKNSKLCSDNCRKQYKKEKMAAYYIENKEHVLSRNKKWSLAHKEQHDKLIDEWNRANKDRKNTVAKEWEKAHPDSIKTRHSKWCKENPLKCVAMSAKRRAIKAKAKGSFTAEEFSELCKKYRNKCLCCGKKKKLTADHVVPLSKGGSNDISNIQPLCNSCNSKKGTKTIDYRT